MPLEITGLAFIRKLNRDNELPRCVPGRVRRPADGERWPLKNAHEKIVTVRRTQGQVDAQRWGGGYGNGDAILALRAEGPHGLPSEVKVFRIGDHALAGLPGVPFAEFSLQVKQDSPAAGTLVGANQGGEVGYVLTQTAFDQGGYEAWPSRSARVGRGAGEFLAERTGDLLRRLFAH